MKHVVSFSGGVSSWAAARIVRDRIMAEGDDLVLLFADTNMEALDVYAFLSAAADDIGEPITRIADGRTPWQVFRDVRFLGNSRLDPCSRILKRDLVAAWMRDNYEPTTTVHHVGLDWTEINRFERWRDRLAADGWTASAPLIDFHIGKPDALQMARARDLPLPSAYRDGFVHANCNGMCVKGGKGHWARLYRVAPDVYAEAERNEEALRRELGNVAILRDRTGGKVRPLPLSVFRQRLDREQCDTLPLDDGGCGCAVD